MSLNELSWRWQLFPQKIQSDYLREFVIDKNHQTFTRAVHETNPLDYSTKKINHLIFEPQSLKQSPERSMCTFIFADT